MIHSMFRAALAALVLAAAPGVGAGDTPKENPAPASTPAPGLTAVPQGARTGLTLTTLDNKAAFELSQGVIGKPVGDHVLLDRQGRPTRLANYRGKPLLVNFIYTACFQVCPTTTKNLQKAVENTVGMLGANRFNVVSIGFNQPFDSPEAMKSFAQQHGIHLPNWEFLSPAAAIVDELTQNFGFSFVSTTAGFDHLNQVTIVDAEGRIFRQIYGEKFTAADLAEPLKAMITGAPIPPQTSTLAELVDRVRIICSVYDPISGKYRTNYALYFEVAGFISFTFFMMWVGWSFMRKRRDEKIQSG
ncbi:MAG: SCO family protein [Betaproteobacteria bacterium]|nr:SCO family protein [Betaproteobacteria bacterium]